MLIAKDVGAVGAEIINIAAAIHIAHAAPFGGGNKSGEDTPACHVGTARAINPAAGQNLVGTLPKGAADVSIDRLGNLEPSC